MLNCRLDFPILTRKIAESPLIYFDSAATALKPKPVVEAISHFYTWQSGTVNRAVYALAREATEAYDQARKKVQTFINAACSDEIIFTRGTTASLNLLARSLGKSFLKKGDRILISEIEHHSNIVPWQMICEEVEARLITIPVFDDGTLNLHAYQELLDGGDVKLVSIAHVSNVLGTLHPVRAVIEAAHQKGAYVCLDGAQSAPHMPIDVQALDVDFFAFSGHKIYGPNGIGVLYGKRQLLEKMPPIEGGGDMIDKVSWNKTTYNTLPFKFEAGTPMIAEAIGLGFSIDYVNQIGMTNIWVHEQQLLDYATKKFVNIPRLTVFGNTPSKGAILSFTIDGIHPLDLATIFDCKGVAVRSGHQCSQPTMDRFNISSCVRISFGIYNSKEEIDVVCEILKNIIKNF